MTSTSGSRPPFTGDGLDPVLVRFCDEIAREPLLTYVDLRRVNTEYFAHVVATADHGAMLDVQLAQAIATSLAAVLEDPPWPEKSHEHRVLHIAVRYFEVEDDAEPDGESVLGFEDDAQVANAVLRYLNREDLLIEIP